MGLIETVRTFANNSSGRLFQRDLGGWSLKTSPAGKNREKFEMRIESNEKMNYKYTTKRKNWSTTAKKSNKKECPADRWLWRLVEVWQPLGGPTAQTKLFRLLSWLPATWSIGTRGAPSSASPPSPWSFSCLYFGGSYLRLFTSSRWTSKFIHSAMCKPVKTWLFQKTALKKRFVFFSLQTNWPTAYDLLIWSRTARLAYGP